MAASTSRHYGMIATTVTMTLKSIISWLMESEVEGRRLDIDEFVDVCFMLTMAGLDTVSASLSCMISWLARHPDERRRVVQDLQQWPLAIEELLRIETPVPVGFREIGEDLELEERRSWREPDLSLRVVRRKLRSRRIYRAISG